jgi:hypothetical protein
LPPLVKPFGTERNGTDGSAGDEMSATAMSLPSNHCMMTAPPESPRHASPGSSAVWMNSGSVDW